MFALAKVEGQIIAQLHFEFRNDKMSGNLCSAEARVNNLRTCVPSTVGCLYFYNILFAEYKYQYSLCLINRDNVRHHIMEYSTTLYLFFKLL